MWFIPAKYEKSTENSVVLTVPSQFFRDQLVTKHKKAIEKKLFELSGKKLSIEFNINKENTANHDETEENAAVSGPISTEKETKKRQKPAKTEDNGRGQHPDLKAEYSFDDFVVGPNNSFAVNAGIAVSTNPGTAYNPMLIYGGVGLGKTHLMQAIGNKIWNNTNLKVIYVTAENFTNEFVECIKKGKMSSFKNKYRNADVLLIDDIHFFHMGSI